MELNHGTQGLADAQPGNNVISPAAPAAPERSARHAD